MNQTKLLANDCQLAQRERVHDVVLVCRKLVLGMDWI